MDTHGAAPIEAEPVPENAAQAENGSAAQDGSVTLTADEFKQAQAHIQQLQKERDDTVSLLQRNQADFDNYRRRNAQVRAESYEEGRRDVMAKLLPVLDNFERAIEAETASDKAWHDGVLLVFKQLNEELGKLGLTVIDDGGKFDPNLHNAVMQEAVEGKETGDIVAVFQKGYKVGERIIRHSMVKVAE